MTGQKKTKLICLDSCFVIIYLHVSSEYLCMVCWLYVPWKKLWIYSEFYAWRNFFLFFFFSHSVIRRTLSILRLFSLRKVLYAWREESDMWFMTWWNQFHIWFKERAPACPIRIKNSMFTAKRALCMTGRILHVICDMMESILHMIWRTSPCMPHPNTKLHVYDEKSCMHFGKRENSYMCVMQELYTWREILYELV